MTEDTIDDDNGPTREQEEAILLFMARFIPSTITTMRKAVQQTGMPGTTILTIMEALVTQLLIDVYEVNKHDNPAAAATSVLSAILPLAANVCNALMEHIENSTEEPPEAANDSTPFFQ